MLIVFTVKIFSQLFVEFNVIKRILMEDFEFNVKIFYNNFVLFCNKKYHQFASLCHFHGQVEFTLMCLSRGSYL